MDIISWGLYKNDVVFLQRMGLPKVDRGANAKDDHMLFKKAFFFLEVAMLRDVGYDLA